MTDKQLPELTDSRRLTGGNLFWERPAAIVDLACAGDPAPFIAAWERAARTLLEAAGHDSESLTHRVFEGGASVLISAPIDALYAMCELNEAACNAARAELAGEEAPDPGSEAERLRELFAEETNPPLLALQAAANEHGVPFLWDDDHVSVGHGATARMWTPDALPAPEAIDWDAIGSIPVAMVTGTNGKSTTVRMAAAILEAAGLSAGLTSTDWIRVGHTILDTGDYSGTGGARTLLRHPQTEVAVLETARGGMLRRGLGVATATAALITNVDADHLGEYGINTVPELIEAKFIVRRALGPGDPLVLNADDPGLVEFAAKLDNTLFWFSLDAGHPVLAAQRAAGGQAAFLEDGWLVRAEGDAAHRVVRVDDIRPTLGGAARHNVSNALGALALCHALGVDDEHVAAGLRAFRGDEHDNPGRSNWFEKDGVRILVDFAHNEHGMRALADMLGRIPAERRVLLMGQAGDRPDERIRNMTVAACSMGVDRLLVSALPGYERGREPMDVPRVIRAAALEAGVRESAIELFDEPRLAVADALSKARPGDLLALLVLTQRSEALQLIHDFLVQE